MTRFVAPDLSKLAPPNAVDEPAFEDILSARKTDLQGRLTTAGHADVASVLDIETEPLTIAQETDAAFELGQRQRVNEGVRACMIATAEKDDLDNLIATFYPAAGPRRTITPASGNTAAVMEKDADYLARALLSVEAYSSAGPEGGYVSFAVEASTDVLDVAVYGEEDGARYANGTPVLAPEVLLVVLSRQGNGVPSPTLLTTVASALDYEEVRPIGDKVTVEPATVVEYSISGVIKVAPGADPAPILAKANAQVAAYVAARQKIGKPHQVLGIGAAMKVTDVEEIALSSPTVDVIPGSKGAAYCTSINLTTAVVQDDWRD